MIGSSQIADCRLPISPSIAASATKPEVFKSAIGNRQSAISNGSGHTGDVNVDLFYVH
jgi:hypothetical protein